MVREANTPTREDLLAAAGGDVRMMRAFERLFRVAGEDVPTAIESIETATQENSVRSKSNGVLAWLSMF